MDNLTGTVERITYRNEENFYSVLRLRSPAQRDLVTAVGYFPQLAVVRPEMVGEVLHPDYGRQFVASQVGVAGDARWSGKYWARVVKEWARHRQEDCAASAWWRCRSWRSAAAPGGGPRSR